VFFVHRYPRSWRTVLHKISSPNNTSRRVPTALCDAVDPCGYAIIEVELKSNAHTYSNRSNSVRSSSGNNKVNTIIRSYGGIPYLSVSLMILNEKNRQLIFVCYYLWYTIILIITPLDYTCPVSIITSKWPPFLPHTDQTWTPNRGSTVKAQSRKTEVVLITIQYKNIIII